MDTTYIVLDGDNADLTLNGYYLSWTLNDDFFKKLESDERFMIQLYSTQFIGDVEQCFTSVTNTSEVYADIKCFNQSNTKSNSGYNLMGIVESHIDITSAVVSSSTLNAKFPIFVSSKFNVISMYVIHQGVRLDFSDNLIGIEKAYCKFVFKLTKIKK